MKMTKVLVLMLAALFLCFPLASCGKNDDNPTQTTKTITLNVYNWGEYISDGSMESLNVNDAFEEYYYEKYGVRVNVNYTTYATNEDM